MTREELKHALISILIGAAVAGVTALVEGLLGLLKARFVDVSGVAAAMIWYFKSVRNA